MALKLNKIYPPYIPIAYFTYFFRAILLLCFFSSISFSQWITSSVAESSLYACPGFEPALVTFNDGSSIIAGYFDDAIYANKFDPSGYALWSNYSTVHFNDSSDYCISTSIFSDGDGGAIFVWRDGRGSIVNQTVQVYQYRAQRVDKNGIKRWGDGGLILLGNEKSLYKYNIIPTSDKETFIFTWEINSGYVGADSMQRLVVRKVNFEGEILWTKLLDSSVVANSLEVIVVGRLADKVLLKSKSIGWIILFDDGIYLQASDLTKHNLLKLDENNNLFAIGSSGNNSSHSNVQIRDSVFYFFQITKYNSNLTFIWMDSLKFYVEGEGVTNTKDTYVFDKNGGFFFINSFYDANNKLNTRLYHLDSLGKTVWDINKVFISDYGVMLGNSSTDGGITLIYFGDARSAVRYDYFGNPLWENQPITVFKETFGVTYFTKCEGDNNGGMICAFWMTKGGIFAKHSGRTGQVGVLTKVSENVEHMHSTFELFQNYPNPFNSATQINFALKNKDNIKLTIFDILGKEIAKLFDKELDAGKYKVQWQANNLSSGVYYYMLKTKHTTITKKMLLIR